MALYDTIALFSGPEVPIDGPRFSTPQKWGSILKETDHQLIHHAICDD